MVYRDRLGAFRPVKGHGHNAVAHSEALEAGLWVAGAGADQRVVQGPNARREGHVELLGEHQGVP